MKKSSIFLVVLLVFSLQFSTGTTSASDVVGPQIQAIYVDNNNVTVGDTFTYSVNLTSPYGVSYADSYLYTLDNNGNLVSLGIFEYTLNTITGLWDLSYTIGEYDENTTIFLYDLYTTDNNDNTIGYGNAAYFSNNHNFTSPEVNVYGTTYDANPPVLNFVNFNQTTVSGGDNLMISAGVTDDVSGISQVYVELYQNTSASDLFSDVFINQYYLNYNSSSGYYYYNVPVSMFWETGDYYLGVVTLIDNAQNMVGYYNASGYSYTFNAPYVFVNNSGVQFPVVNDVFFAYDTIDEYGDQQVYLNISLNGFNLDYGYIQLSYVSPGSTLTYFYFDNTYLDPNTGLYTFSFNAQDFGIPETYFDIYVPSVEIYSEQSYLYFYNWTDYHSDTFYITDSPNGDPFSVTITPESGVNDVGQPVLFEVTMSNYLTYDVSGTLDVFVSGPNPFTVVTDVDYYLYAGSEDYYTFELHFNVSGDYTVTAEFTTYDGSIYTADAQWQVNDGTHNPGTEQISLSSDPASGGSSLVDETVVFTVKVESTFTHEMPNVTLVVAASGPGNDYSDSFILTLPPNSAVTQQVSITFVEAGDYTIVFTLIDDIGAEWQSGINWKVEHSDGSNTDTVDDNEPSNDSLPELELPGFGFYVTISSVFTMLAITYRRRQFA